MNVAFFRILPWFPLISLTLAYALLGWYLSAYHIFWFVGAFVAAVASAGSWKSLFLLERLVKFFSQAWLIILTILMLSVLLILAATWSILLPVIVLPLAATFLANVEMRFAGFSRLNTFLVLTVLAGFGLGFGEIIDLLFLSSKRY